MVCNLSLNQHTKKPVIHGHRTQSASKSSILISPVQSLKQLLESLTYSCSVTRQTCYKTVTEAMHFVLILLFQKIWSRSHFIIVFQSGGVTPDESELNHININTKIIKATCRQKTSSQLQEKSNCFQCNAKVCYHCTSISSNTSHQNISLFCELIVQPHAETMHVSQYVYIMCYDCMYAFKVPLQYVHAFVQCADSILA